LATASTVTVAPVAGALPMNYIGDLWAIPAGGFMSGGWPGSPEARETMKRLRIEYFAILREQAGRSMEELETDAATPAELFAELARRHSFADKGRFKVAINAEFSDWDAPLSEGDSIVFIPPVAGG